MRFHQPVGIAQHFNGNINEVNNTASVDNSNINQIYLSQAVQLDQLKKLLQAHNYENNEIKTSNLNKNNSTSNHLQYKADSAYFKSFLDNHCFISNNGNDRTTSALTEENLTKVKIKHPKNCHN